MPNLVDPISADVLARFPGATVHGRGQDHIDYDVGGGRHIFTAVGGHIHYQDAGQWQEINTDFGNSGRQGYADNNSTARFLCDVDGNTGRDVIPRRDRTGEYFTLGRPQYWTGSQWRNLNLPGRVRSGQSLAWDGANIAFSIEHTGRGLKYNVTLKNSTNATNVRWAYTLTGLHWSDWDLVSDSTGEVVTSFRVPTMTDANGVVREVAASNAGGYITFTPDYSGLAYPIEIDPTFTDGYGGDVSTYKDTMVDGGGTTAQKKNFGVATYLIDVGANHGLIEFDVSSIASGSTCNSATFYLYHYATGAANADTTSIYSIASGNAAWIEGTHTNIQAAAGEPCWNALAADGAGGVTTAWAGSAGLATATTDYETPALGSFAEDRANAVGYAYSTTLTTSRVAGWFGASNTNYGLKVAMPNNGGGFCSSDHATTGYRPKLVVDYTAAGGPTANYKTVDGAVTYAGISVKQAGKIFAGGLTSIGIPIKLTGTTAGGALTFAGVESALRLALQTLAGALTSSGDAIKQTGKGLAGAVTSSGAVVGTYNALKSLVGALTFTGIATKQTATTFAAALTFAGVESAFKVALKTLAGAVTTGGVLVKQTNKAFTGALNQAGVVVKETYKTFTAGLTSAGTIARSKVTFKTISGALTYSGAVVKQAQVSIAGGLTGAGALIKQAAIILAGALTPSGVVSAVLGALPQVPGQGVPVRAGTRGNLIASVRETLQSRGRSSIKASDKDGG